MFEYKTRTETINGCKFIQQDILLFDYSYSGDCVIECVVDYIVPGFGFVLLEDSANNISNSENMYLIKFGKRNQYQIINKQLSEQSIVKDEFILSGKDIDTPLQNLRLVLKYTDNDTIGIYFAEKDENGINIETQLIDYRFPHEINNYKIGFYSNGGNTLKFAAIETEAPSNWISNIFNGNGGRIHWIKNGFIIEDCEFDCEVESQNNILDPGIYYFDFECDNPNIKYYLYPAELKDTDIKRPMDEILATMKDEDKNILNYEDGSFEVLGEEPQRINIKFKGKWGTVKNICVKKNKYDDFVETDYDNIKREASRIEFDLSKISKIEMTATVTNLPNDLNNLPQYDLFLCGSQSVLLDDVNVELNQKINYVFTTEDRVLEVNNTAYNLLSDTTDNKLIVLNNVDAYVTNLIITTITGDVIDVILQKTFRITVNKNINTPIIVTDMDHNPLNISSSYREVIEQEQLIEIFNQYNSIKLNHRLCLNDSNIRVAGINSGIIDLSKNTIEELGADYTLISPNYYTVDYKYNQIKIDKTERNKYKYIVVEYRHCDNFRIEFTNYEREIFDLNTDENLYLESTPSDVVGAVIVYGIPRGQNFYSDYIYRIPNIRAINSIDYCAPVYNILLSDSYIIEEGSNKLTLNTGVRSQYDYLIVDYLKEDNYTVNERDNYYEVDISTSQEKCLIIYDSTETEVINIYKQLNLDNIQENNFIVLRKREV